MKIDPENRRSFVKKSLATSMTITFAGLIRAHGDGGGQTTTFDLENTYVTTSGGTTTTFDLEETVATTVGVTTTWDPEETTIATTNVEFPVSLQKKLEPDPGNKQEQVLTDEENCGTIEVTFNGIHVANLKVQWNCSIHSTIKGNLPESSDDVFVKTDCAYCIVEATASLLLTRSDIVNQHIFENEIIEQAFLWEVGNGLNYATMCCPCHELEAVGESSLSSPHYVEAKVSATGPFGNNRHFVNGFYLTAHQYCAPSSYNGVVRVITEMRLKLQDSAHYFNAFVQYMEDMIVLLAAAKGVERNNVGVFWLAPQFPVVENSHMQDVIAYTLPPDVDGFSCPFIAELQNWENMPMPSSNFDNVLTSPPYIYEPPSA